MNKSKKNGQLMTSYEDVNGDKFMDVIIHIITENLQLKSTDIQANLEGQLISGEIIKGSDSVKIVP